MTHRQRILVTGGCGFIGAEVVLQLLAADYSVLVVDNFVNSSREVLRRLSFLSGICVADDTSLSFRECDVTDQVGLRALMTEFQGLISAVIHFAALKAVGDSITMPIAYYKNNVGGSLCLLELMEEFGVTLFVFSSSATVYGEVSQDSLPCKETDELLPSTNPYASTKLVVEMLLREMCVSNANMRVANLRYFNPIGAHPSGLLGEDPNGPPNNLFPYISQTLVGRRDVLRVWGNDYNTPDGTGVRDYLDVVDLAEGHVAALKGLKNGQWKGFRIFNLGTGKGLSVLEAVHAMEDASHRKCNYQICPRRKGDIAECYCCPLRAAEELGWNTKRSLKETCQNLWRFQSLNPKGLEEGADLQQMMEKGAIE